MHVRRSECMRRTECVRKSKCLRRSKEAQKTLILQVLLIFICLSALGIMIFPASTEAQEQVKIITVTVNKGDSLWKLAEKYDNNQMDLRKYVDIIQEYNKLNNVTLQPGQQLKIPVYHNGEIE